MGTDGDVIGDRLPGPVVRWIEAGPGGPIVALERNASRREGWVVTVARPEGPLECFLRLDRDHGVDVTIKEAKVVEALAGHGIPVPGLFGYDEGLRAALYERVPGRPDLNNADPAEQRSVFEHFMEILGAWHSLDAGQLGLGDRLPWPEDAYQAAMLEVDKVEAESRSGELGEPLVTFATEWLRRHVPADLDRVVLLQGDTGPANFLFADGRVTAVIDWEWAHFGDPMEDLGNVAYRNMFHPSGNLAELLPLYTRAGGPPLDYERIMYFRVQQSVRTLIALVRASVENDTNSPVAMMLAYRLINDRVTCEAIAEAMGRPLVRPAPVLDETPVPGTTLGQATAEILTTEVLATAESDWARFRLNDLAVAVQCLDRRIRFGPRVDALDRDAVNSLLGTAHLELGPALAELNGAMADLMATREREVLEVLAGRAYRAEELYRPAVDLFPDRVFGPLR